MKKTSKMQPRKNQFVVEMSADMGELTMPETLADAKETAIDMLTDDGDEGEYATIYELVPRFTVRIGAVQVNKIGK